MQIWLCCLGNVFLHCVASVALLFLDFLVLLWLLLLSKERGTSCPTHCALEVPGFSPWASSCPILHILPGDTIHPRGFTAKCMMMALKPRPCADLSCATGLLGMFHWMTHMHLQISFAQAELVTPTPSPYSSHLPSHLRHKSLPTSLVCISLCEIDGVVLFWAGLRC